MRFYIVRRVLCTDLNYSNVLPIQSFPAISVFLSFKNLENICILEQYFLKLLKFRNQLSIQLGKGKLNNFVKSQNKSKIKSEICTENSMI